MGKNNIEQQMGIEKLKPDEIVLQPGEIGVVLELIVHKPSGELVEHRKLKSKSFVRQFLEILWVQCYNLPSLLAGGAMPKDTGGAARGVDQASGNFSAVAAVGITTNGIIVGIGITAPTINDYKMETPIAHGIGAGQLQYSAMTFGLPSATGSISQFRLTRDFSNGSGASISMNELGLYVIASGYYFLAIRDVLGTPLEIPNGDILTINYEEQAAI